MATADPVSPTADNVAIVAKHLGEAIAEFDRLGVRLRSSNRLLRSLQTLEKVGAAGQYPTTRKDLTSAAEAIRTAQEFIAIADVLGSAPPPSVIADLRLAVGGDLDPTVGKAKTHLQHQAQLWVGAALIAGGASAGVLLRPRGTNPDYVLPEGTLSYGVEVKRPESLEDGYDLVREAARQVSSARFHGGVIVVDLTDCIEESASVQFGRGAPDTSGIGAELASKLRLLHREIFDEDAERLRPGRDHVFSLLGMTRVAYWDEDDLTQPHIGRLVATVEYWRRDGRTLRGHRAKWLGGLVHAGIEALGGVPSTERVKLEL